MSAYVRSSAAGIDPDSNTTFTVGLPPTIVTGDLLLFIYLANASGASTTDHAAKGWWRYNAQSVNTRQWAVYARIYNAADPSSVYTLTSDAAAAPAWVSAAIADHAVVASTDLFVGVNWRRSDNGGSQSRIIAPSITLPTGDQLVLALTGEASNTLGARRTINANGFALVNERTEGPTASLSIDWVTMWQKLVAAAGATGDFEITFGTEAVPSPSLNGVGLQVAVPSKVIATPAKGFDNVFQMIRRGGCTWAHRGGSSNWPEMSEYAFDQAVLAGYSALEFSAQRTSDGVWVGCHDIDLNRTSETTGLPNISTMTWVQVQTHMNSLNSGGTPRPYYRLIDFLDKYTPTHVCIVDPKNAVNFKDEFLALCDAHGGPSRIVQKFFGVGSGSIAFADAARLKGYQAWGYFYEADFTGGTLDANQSHWSILGMNINAPQAAWDAALSYGKPVVGHIATTQAMYDTAIANGADIVQCANVAGIAAVGRQDEDHFIEYDGTDSTPVELVEWDGTFLKAVRVLEKN